MSAYAPILDNIADGDTVHQRCVLVTGRVPVPQAKTSMASSVSIVTADESDCSTFPEHRWPLAAGHFKALLILTPGVNRVTITAEIRPASLTLTLNYVPLLQLPPLHLAIMIAKDSPLQVDCPPAKYGAISSAHSSLDAAVAKLRMSAYMWQAMTAEDLRAKGLGRRSFRLDEQWGLDTLSRGYTDARLEDSLADAMQSTAKVHLVRTDRTVAELRDMQRAQQNPSARNSGDLHSIFSQALKQHGGVFESSAHPVVAGLILDAHYSVKQKMILAHAALGAHDPNGLSLGIFGSHLSYSWPRFIEEVPDSLLDTRPPGDLVGDDNGECASMWEACAVGQGAFLHEVGHAFSAPHTTGIMARGYSQNWPKCFLSRTANCVAHRTSGVEPVTADTPNECTWDLRDALRFANLRHFRLPSDARLSGQAMSAPPKVELLDDEDFLRIGITSEAGIARVYLNGQLEEVASVAKPATSLKFTADELETRFDRAKKLEMELVAMNGRHRTLNVWQLLSDRTYVRVPGTSIRLQKKSVGSDMADQPTRDVWRWAVMLKKKTRHGLIAASKIDLRVGCGLDGAVVYYRDGTSIPCGPRWRKDGSEHHMGGHQARKMALPEAADISKVQVGRYQGSSGSLRGLRMHLSNGRAMGALNGCRGDNCVTLAPPDGHKIIGFYGTSYSHGMCCEFGIVSAPADAELPDSMYELPELQNTDGGTGTKQGRRWSRKSYAGGNDDHDDGEGAETSEDEDGGYDNAMDEEDEEEM